MYSAVSTQSTWEENGILVSEEEKESLEELARRVEVAFGVLAENHAEPKSLDEEKSEEYHSAKGVNFDNDEDFMAALAEDSDNQISPRPEEDEKELSLLKEDDEDNEKLQVQLKELEANKIEYSQIKLYIDQLIEQEGFMPNDSTTENLKMIVNSLKAQLDSVKGDYEPVIEKLKAKLSISEERRIKASKELEEAREKCTQSEKGMEELTFNYMQKLENETSEKADLQQTLEEIADIFRVYLSNIPVSSQEDKIKKLCDLMQIQDYEALLHFRPGAQLLSFYVQKKKKKKKKKSTLR
eukprot:TRINITY_DN3046_c0_g1_i1.p2 TRINITY_DN3046_c0_g1~~TRINITY_DN3046_c0_g1_i1.p2  ORF type:complete len:297 (-),score=96.53 TRINITY_DN3046_c0_g1_i1:5-895(-)